MRYVGFDFVQFDDHIHAKNLFSKVSLVEFSIEDHFVKMLKLS